MDVKNDNSITVGVYIASIDFLELVSFTAVITTFAEKDINWKTVMERLIDEWRTQYSPEKEAKVSQNHRKYFKRSGHRAAKCWKNAENPNN